VIDVENLVFDHPSGRALYGVGFVVRAGATLALTGPEGSGKSTLMRCIAALDAPTAGRISVAGLDTQDDPRGVHALVGYLPVAFGLYDALSARQCLTYAARARGVEAADLEAAVALAAERVGLGATLNRLAGELPPGGRRRLGLAQAIVHSPRVLLLDRAADGLEGLARLAFDDLIRTLAATGVTTVLSATSVSDLHDICTEVLELDAGRMVDDGVRRLPPRPPAASAAEAEVEPESEPRPDDDIPPTPPS
jgi:ABC-2 type transport system ATP-binding protein